VSDAQDSNEVRNRENGLSAVAEAIEIPDAGDRTFGQSNVQQDTRRFAEAALANSKREGLQLAVRARWIALAVIAVTLPISNPHRDVIYYVLMLGFFAAIGWAQLKIGKAGWSWQELSLMFCDLALLTFIGVPRIGRSGCSSTSTRSAITLSCWRPRRWPIRGARFSPWAS
jgi:hypothetical protein